MVGAQYPVRLSMGTGQELSGTSTKFLEPPTALAAVPPFSTSLARKTLERLRQDERPQALVVLTEWAHPRRRLELAEEDVTSIVMSKDDEALEALEELRNQRTFWRGNGRSLTLPVIVDVDSHVHHLEGLVDSGCEGSCINRDVVERLGLKTRKLAWMIPVFNADGQPNAGGPVMETVRLDIKIAGRPERSTFAVVDLGGGEVFLRYDWLQVTNPTSRRSPTRIWTPPRRRGCQTSLESDDLSFELTKSTPLPPTKHLRMYLAGPSTRRTD
jgi:hypothetical protein